MVHATLTLYKRKVAYLWQHLMGTALTVRPLPYTAAGTDVDIKSTQHRVSLEAAEVPDPAPEPETKGKDDD